MTTFDIIYPVLHFKHVLAQVEFLLRTYIILNHNQNCLCVMVCSTVSNYRHPYLDSISEGNIYSLTLHLGGLYFQVFMYIYIHKTSRPLKKRHKNNPYAQEKEEKKNPHQNNSWDNFSSMWMTNRKHKYLFNGGWNWLGGKQKSESGMTANLLKQDPNT